MSLGVWGYSSFVRLFKFVPFHISNIKLVNIFRTTECTYVLRMWYELFLTLRINKTLKWRERWMLVLMCMRMWVPLLSLSFFYSFALFCLTEAQKCRTMCDIFEYMYALYLTLTLNICIYCYPGDVLSHVNLFSTMLPSFILKPKKMRSHPFSIPLHPSVTRAKNERKYLLANGFSWWNRFPYVRMLCVCVLKLARVPASLVGVYFLLNILI